MKIFTFKELSLAPRGGVIALGFFDGVHLAHRKLFDKARSEARLRGVPFGVFTFTSESDIKKNAKRLYTTEERLEIIGGLSADFTLLADFSEICSFGAEEFVVEILVKGLGASVSVAGYNFKFGKGALGTSELLSKLMRENGREAITVDEISLRGKEVSSTVIRSLIEGGKIEEANELLGSPYTFFGKVEHGESLGKKLGFPTLNTKIQDGKATPKSGVYRSAVLLDGKVISAVTNIGKCPTFGEREIHLETHLIDFGGDIYGKDIKIFLLGYLREERLFSSKEELVMQIKVDKNTTIKKNGEEKWQELGLK